MKKVDKVFLKAGFTDSAKFRAAMDNLAKIKAALAMKMLRDRAYDVMTLNWCFKDHNPNEREGAKVKHVSICRRITGDNPKVLMN